MDPELSELDQAQERERARIAASIHDDALQILSAIAMTLELAQRTVADPTARDVLAEAHDEVEQANVRLRQHVVELLPPPPSSPLRAALDAHCAALFSGSSIQYELRGDPRALPSETRLLAYRLAQEALRNVLRHSDAKRVLTTLDVSRRELTVSVLDDGVGWESAVASEPDRAHAGLHIIRLRAETAGGSARTGAGLGERGASVEIRLPIGAH